MDPLSLSNLFVDAHFRLVYIHRQYENQILQI